MWDEPDILGNADEDAVQLIENPAFGRFDLSLRTSSMNTTDAAKLRELSIINFQEYVFTCHISL